eukprot:544471_1
MSKRVCSPSMVVLLMYISSAKKRELILIGPIFVPMDVLFNCLIRSFIKKLNNIGDDNAPWTNPSWVVIGLLILWFILITEVVFLYIAFIKFIVWFGTLHSLCNLS